MDTIDMEDPPPPQTPFSDSDSDADICTSILTRFGSSRRHDHHHLCAVIGAMAHSFKDQNLPPSPVAYFGATCSSLDRILSDPYPSGHAVDALLTILALAVRRVSPAILVNRTELVTGILVRAFRCGSLSVAGAVSGLKCITHLLIVGSGSGHTSWTEASKLFGFVLSFATVSRTKVRRQAHLRLHDLLQSFQGSSLHSAASQAITDSFKRLLLLAGGTKQAASSSEGAKGSLEVLYLLDAFKDCLALMSTKNQNEILELYKPLLALQNPVVSRRITDGLYRLCLEACPDVSPQKLLDLLCSISLSVSNNKTSVDDMTFTARLFSIGMTKVYTLDRQLCVVKLPTVFTALQDILGSGHEEAIHAAVNAFKTLIEACIDESLIKQGVDQIVATGNTDERRSGPTVIEKVCANIESLICYHYTAVLDLAFQIVSAMFNKLGVYSSYFMRGTLKSLADMEKLPDEDFPFRKELHECLGTALVAIGPETFIGFLPLNLEADDLGDVNVWLFPILKQYTIGARLSFFTDSILSMVEVMKNKSRQLQSQGRIISSRSIDALVYSLWSLLPSFCNFPSDTAKSFNDLKQPLCNSLRDEPDIRGIICLSLQTLVQQNKNIAEDLSDTDVGTAKQRAIANYTPEVRAENLSVLKSSARKVLTILSGVFLNSTKDDGGCLQSTICEFASISDKQDVSRLFVSNMHKLLKVTKEASVAGSSSDSTSRQRALLFDLAISFLPGLNAEEVDVLFNAIKPALQDAEGLIQKKAYKVLSIILGDFDEFISSKLEDLLKLMVELLPSCHFSARRHRLDCLYVLMVHVSKSEREQRWHEITGSFLTEIILGLKEANKKTRNKAYDILVQIGHACGDEEKGGKKENLYQFFNMVAGGLAGETPLIISAAMRGLARLAYEFSDLVASATSLLPSTFLLLRRKNREIIKANLGLLKVLVAKSQAEGLQLHLKSMVEALLKWQDDSRTHFKAKIKLLLEMLVKKCGMDAVKAVMPQEHMKLLTNIRKIKERKDKKQQTLKSEEAKSHASKATTARLSRWNHSKVFSDFGDDETDESDADYMDTQTVPGGRGKSAHLKSKVSSSRAKSRTNKNLPDHLFDQLEDEPLDLLDRGRTRSALRSSGNSKRKMESDEGPEIDPDGRLIIREESKSYNDKSSTHDSDTKSETGSHSSVTTKKIQKRRKTSESGWAATGNEYASKKAGGDLKKKDQLEPYAYWPLDRKMMSRRPEHRVAARKGISSVVRMTKKLEGKSASSSILTSKGLKFKRVQKKGSKRKSKYEL